MSICRPGRRSRSSWATTSWAARRCWPNSREEWVMAAPHPSSPRDDQGEPRLKIYFLPNLLTAGNLFCGFVALTKIVEADIQNGNFQEIKVALGFILLACIFDLF